MPRVFDGSTFFNDRDLLEIRPVELDPVVDAFVLVEATKTVRGAPKPLHFTENADRFRRRSHKIRHIVIDDFGDLSRADRLHPTKRPASADWARRWLQRDAIRRGMTDAARDDLVMISDLDEIPRRRAVRDIVDNGDHRRRLSCFENRTQVNFLDWTLPDAAWIGTRAVEARRLPSPQTLRLLHHAGNVTTPAAFRRVERVARTWRVLGAMVAPVRLPDAGWHFTSLGGADAVSGKIGAVSDPSRRVGDTSAHAIARRFRQGLSHDDRKIAVTAPDDMPDAVRRDPARYRALTSASLNDVSSTSPEPTA